MRRKTMKPLIFLSLLLIGSPALAGEKFMTEADLKGCDCEMTMEQKILNYHCYGRDYRLELEYSQDDYFDYKNQRYDSKLHEQRYKIYRVGDNKEMTNGWTK